MKKTYCDICGKQIIIANGSDLQISGTKSLSKPEICDTCSDTVIAAVNAIPNNQ